MSITPNIHEHPLILVNTRCNDITTPMSMNKVEDDLCNGCVNPIMDEMSFYKCTSQGCNFVLHEWCAKLPTELKNYKGHSQHSLLVLFPKVPDHQFIRIYLHDLGVFLCDVCKRLCNGFVYSCVKCSYNVDVTCALIRKKVSHKSHPNHLLSRVTKRKDKDSCRMCLSPFTNSTEISFSCESCDFHLHPKCALLPETVRSKYDKHPMTLSYFPIENHEGDYFCEECEDELNPNAWFYHCHECVQSMHPACAHLIPQIKPCIFNGLSLTTGVSKHEMNIKFGSIHKIKIHPHPLSFSEVLTENEVKCANHFDKFTDSWPNLVLKCIQCNFLIHAVCALYIDMLNIKVY